MTIHIDHTGESISSDSSLLIISASGSAINITPGGAGAIVLDGLSWPTSDGTGGHHLTTDGAGWSLF